MRSTAGILCMGMAKALAAARQQRTGKASRSFSVDPVDRYLSIVEAPAAH